MTMRWSLVVGLALVAGAAGATGCDTTTGPAQGTKILDADQFAGAKAISGGTLAITPDGQRAVVSEPDVDRITVIDLATKAVVASFDLQTGDEPGRIIAIDNTDLLVALRRGGAIVKVNVTEGLGQRMAVCASPRGFAYDSTTEQIHVACTGGDLVTLDAAGTVVRRLNLGRDLRDVVLDGDILYVSRFRAASVIRVNAKTGAIELEETPPTVRSASLSRDFRPSVAWRMKASPNGGVTVMHQRALVDPIPDTTPGQKYYGGSCDQVILHTAASVFGRAGHDSQAPVGGLGTIALPVDFDTSAGGDLAVVSAASNRVVVLSAGDITSAEFVKDCAGPEASNEVALDGEPTSVLYRDANEMLVQLRTPPAVVSVNMATGEQTSIALSTDNRANVGHRLFHQQPNDRTPISCASCHPGGRDDGHVWDFASFGPRRTQNLSGGVMETLPLHWDGTLTTMHNLMDEVFIKRMGGAEVHESRTDAMATWLNNVDVLPVAVVTNAEAATRGDALYHDAVVGCANCHSGDHLTNNLTLDAGTGQPFQVPSLVGIADRAPFMHNGCAPTLTDRFTDQTCGGGDAHGKTSQLSPEQIADLVTYLETL